ncbi:MAG: urease accessory protein UreE [Pseudomonadota bacterium]
MLEVFERLGLYQEVSVDAWIVLSHGQRDKGRLKAQTSSGDEVHIFLDRGNPLMVGEVLRTRCGKHLGVEGAPEAVTIARCDDWETFSRACYHLGNRHVKVQIGELWLRLLPDHVLENMLKLQGLTIQREIAVFQPEPGAYSGLAIHHH